MTADLFWTIGMPVLALVLGCVFIACVGTVVELVCVFWRFLRGRT